MTKKEYVSPTVSGHASEGEFIVPAVLAMAAGALASAAVKSLLNDNFSALDVKPLPACVTV